jgi:hypothetical protein
LYLERKRHALNLPNSGHEVILRGDDEIHEDTTSRNQVVV